MTISLVSCLALALAVLFNASNDHATNSTKNYFCECDTIYKRSIDPATGEYILAYELNCDTLNSTEYNPPIGGFAQP